MRSRYMVLDFEFTTYGDKAYGKPRAFFHEIIEIGAVLLDVTSSSIEPVYQSFIRPIFYPKLTNECSRLTQINQQDVDHGVELAEALQKMEQAYVPGKTYWVGYGDADHDVLAQVCIKYKIPNPFPSEDYIDLASQFKLFYAKERRLSLKNAVREVGLELDGIEHTAMDDAKNAAQLLLKMIQDGWIPNTDYDNRSNI